MTNDLGVDCISREQAIEEADKLTLETGYDNEKVVEMLEDLPSVTPQEPKTGHWIYICNSAVNGLKIVECSECGMRTYGSGKYCPNCGAKMESEDNK